MLNCFWLFATPWTVSCQTPLSIGFSRQEYWIGLPFPPSGDFSNPRIKEHHLPSPTFSGRVFSTEPFRSLLLLLSRFSRYRLCATPYTAAHQAPPSLGFSRQEYWSRFPFPSPVHESEKWEWSRSVMSNSWRPHGLQPTKLLHPRDFPGKSTRVGCHCLLPSEAYLCLNTEIKVWKTDKGM